MAFFNSNYGPLKSVDTSGITQAGQAWGNMFQQLGQQLGQTAQTAIGKYRENKQKKEDQENFKNIGLRLYKSNPKAFSQFGANDEGEVNAFLDEVKKKPEAMQAALQWGMMAEQAELRELQMQQSRQAMDFARERAGFASEQARFSREDRDLKEEERDQADILARFMTSRPDPIASENAQLRAQSPELRIPPDAGRRNVLAGTRFETPLPVEPAPMELGPSERFHRIASDPNLDPRSKMEAMNQAKAEAMAQQKLAAEQGSAALANQIKVNAEGRNQTGFTQEQSIMSFDGLTIGTGENASILQGKIGDKAEAIKAKEGLNNLNSILRDLDQLIALGYKRENSRVLSDDDKEKAAQLANRVRGQIREEILGPGTVTGPEFDRLAAQVPDPTAGFDLFSAQFGEEGSRLLEQVKADLIKKVKGKFAAYDVTTGGTANPGNTRQISTGKEVEILFDPAE